MSNHHTPQRNSASDRPRAIFRETTPDTASPAGIPEVGATFGAGYTLRERVGQGPLGPVYRAEPTRLGRDVAVKFLHPHLLGDERSQARFYIEARAASRLNHPNTVAVLDYGQEAGKAPYLVTEYLHGMHLRTLLSRSGPLAPRTAVRIAIEVLSALAEAHGRRIVHRDLKPENIFLVPRREGGHHVKVAGFGLARLLESDNPEVARLGWGGPRAFYASPEQWAGEQLDGRADLYAVGIILFEMLTGKVPFVGDTARLAVAHFSERAPLVSAAAPGQRSSPVLDEIVRQALEKNASERFASADEMISALRDALDGLGAPATRASRCSACGVDYPHLSRYCAECGSPRFTLTPDAPSAAQAPRSPLAMLLSLEQKAQANERTDIGATIDACRRGLELARKTHLATGDDLFEHAVLSFSVKLGEALRRGGQLAEAEGVLAEALSYGAAANAPRARLLLTLGRVCAARGSWDRARVAFAEALGSLSREPDLGLAADIHEAYAAVCRESGAFQEAIRALQAACDALGRLPQENARRARTLLTLGELNAHVASTRVTPPRVVGMQSRATEPNPVGSSARLRTTQREPSPAEAQRNTRTA